MTTSQDQTPHSQETDPEIRWGVPRPDLPERFDHGASEGDRDR
jgi:hypothetical protein